MPSSDRQARARSPSRLARNVAFRSYAVTRLWVVTVGVRWGVARGRRRIWPVVGGALALAEEAAATREWVVWLDDRERFLGDGRLRTTGVDESLAGDGHHRAMVATLRSE